MSFGLANAPVLFRHMINVVLRLPRYSATLGYMDGMLLQTTTIDEGFVHVRRFGSSMKSGMDTTIE